MVVFSILLVEEMFAFKYATVRLFGGKKNITEFFVDPLPLFATREWATTSHQCKVVVVFPLDVLKAGRQNFWEVNF